jgi:hypothetical protein
MIPQKLERNVSHARGWKMDPGASPEVSLFGNCPKMHSISALECKMKPDPALTGRACWLDIDMRVRVPKVVVSIGMNPDPGTPSLSEGWGQFITPLDIQTSRGRQHPNCQKLQTGIGPPGHAPPVRAGL